MCIRDRYWGFCYWIYLIKLNFTVTTVKLTLHGDRHYIESIRNYLSIRIHPNADYPNESMDEN